MQKLRKYLFKAVARTADADDYGDEMPTMRLSSALIVVGLLHVVAIGGIWAFNNIKTHKSAGKSSAAIAAAVPAKSLEAVSATPPPSVAPQTVANEMHPAAEGKKPIAPATATSVPTAAPVAKVAKVASNPVTTTTSTAAPLASGQTYTVVKGDNPVSIAKKHKVSYEALLKLNQIEDPRKLRIGQVLKLPKATSQP